MGAAYGIVAILLVLLGIGPGDSTLLLPLRDVCKFGGEVSYYSGINEARVSFSYDLTAAYPPNVDCTLHITESGVNAGVKMSFLSFDMAPAVSDMCQDYIEMMKVDPADGLKKTILSRTCGCTVPVNMTERVNEVILKAKTSATKQSNHTGFVLLFKRYDQATNPAATPTQAPADGALIGGAVFGAVLGVILLVLLAFCIFCVFRHKRDLLRRKKVPDRFSSYMRSANPPPPGPTGLRRTAPPSNNDWRGYVRQNAYTQY